VYIFIFFKEKMEGVYIDKIKLQIIFMSHNTLQNYQKEVRT
jgi:hypothetical protein